MEATLFATPRRRVFAGLIGAFASIAVMLAVVGVYGVMSQIVKQRTNEIGIRIALGANASSVRRLVVRHGLVLIGAGLLAGFFGAISMTRVLRGALFGISEMHLPAFIVALVVLGGIALFACYVPARRASRIDPISALHHE